MRTLWVGTAGFAGAVARYGLDGLVGRHARGAFPWATLAVNLSGSFLLGLLFALFTERWVVDGDLRVALTVGFVGSYTTFSTFALETLRLGQDGRPALAVANVVVSVVAGLLAVWAGMAVARAF